MLSKGVGTLDDLPEDADLIFEPKWDGFRCIVFRDGDEVVLGSRNERPLTRYFPELVESLKARLPDRIVLDGEIVIASASGLDFDALQLRIHPAESRINKLAVEIPSSFVAFDLLALGNDDLRPTPYGERRRLLESVLAGVAPPVYLTPATVDRAVAADWFDRFEGAGLDGVVVKPLDLPYKEDVRAMVKVKHERTADCVVAGFRWHKSGGVVGSLLLGLFDESGSLHHVGVTASFTMARRKELVDELEPYREGADVDHPWGGWASMSTEGPNVGHRWAAKKDMTFELLRAELVCEVAYDHLQGERFRHATTFRRWRPDRQPASCTYDQLDSAAPSELASVFGA
jgi:ATP-dependent DNA ligase